jgi:hypothetical protein
MTRPLLEQGMREVDQAWRQRGISTRPSSPTWKDSSESSRPRNRGGFQPGAIDAGDFADMTQGLLHGFRPRRTFERDHFHSSAKRLYSLTLALLARVSIGSSSMRGVLGQIKHQLGRAHGGAAGRGGQHAVAVIGEENGVDQLRFAARELGDKGYVQAVFAQALGEVRQSQVRLGIVQLVFNEPGAEAFKAATELAAPFGIGGKLLGERHRRSRLIQWINSNMLRR